MAADSARRIADVDSSQQDRLLEEWLKEQMAAPTLRMDLMTEAELRQQSRQFLNLLAEGAGSGRLEDLSTPEWAPLRDLLGNIARTRATQGFSPSETATFIFSFKQPLFAALRKADAGNAEALAEDTWAATKLLDGLGLTTIESYHRTRDEIIRNQQQELLELSTPVVQLWDGILALPLIGTLDSTRAQVVMESLLHEIVNTRSTVAIIDITGVPTVDTLVAQHLLRTIAAARLMGADCIISGIRPAIAQTIIHLGVVLSDVTTKANLADALALAFKRAGIQVTKPSPKE